jgi:hypothetical protein
LLLYIGYVVNLMDETIVENLSNVANYVLTGGSAVMITGDLEILPITVVALILVLLVARLLKRKTFRARGSVTNKGVSGRLFNKQRSPELKSCPNCNEQLPLSAIICDICDYNFLAARPGRGQNLLPPPQPITHEVLAQEISSPRL